LMIGLAHHGQTAPVAEIMTKDCTQLETDEPLTDALARMQETDCQIAPVVENDRIVGLMTMENIGEFMMIRSALEEARNRHLA
jgi:CBS domain-containing protein